MLRGNSDRSVKLSTRLRTMPTLKNTWSYTSNSIFDFIEWCSNKYTLLCMSKCLITNPVMSNCSSSYGRSGFQRVPLKTFNFATREHVSPTGAGARLLFSQKPLRKPEHFPWLLQVVGLNPTNDKTCPWHFCTSPAHPIRTRDQVLQCFLFLCDITMCRKRSRGDCFSLAPSHVECLLYYCNLQF